MSEGIVVVDRAGAPHRSVALDHFAAIGASFQKGLENMGASTRFAVEVGRAARDIKTWWPELLTQMRLLGVASLPITAFIALFTGIVLALLASYTLTGAAVPVYFVGTAAEKGIAMELAPVLTGLALAGRVGANIAAEVGTMRVTEQIDAFETLAYEPEAYLVVPRVLAGTLTFPILVGLAIVGVASAWIASQVLLDMPTAEFVKGVRRTLIAMATAGSGTLGRVMGDASLYDHTDSLMTELRVLVADIKAHPNRYVSVHVF